MLDFTFTEEQEMFRKMVADFVKKEVVPGYKERQKLYRLPVAQRIIPGQKHLLGYPADIRKKAGELGLCGLDIPEKYGGNPQGAITIGVCTEESAGYDLNIGANHIVNFFLFSTEEMREEWLPGIAQGEKTLGFGATEAEAGSDLRNIKATARKDGKFWILNGEKNRVSGCYDSDGVVVLCWTTDSAAPQLSPFLITWDMPGVTRSALDDIAVGSYAGIVSMEDVRVPEQNRLVKDAQGFYTTMRIFDGNRATMGLNCMRIAKMTLDETIEYVKQRVAFGRPIAKWEGVQFPIAEAATYIELGRWMCYRILWMQEQRLPTTLYASMIKWWAPVTSEWIIHECLLLHGHYGYSQDMPFGDRLLSLSGGLGAQLGEAPAQIQKMIIARELLGKEYLPYR